MSIPTNGGGGVEIQIPEELARWFREQLSSEESEREERSYKWAVHPDPSCVRSQGEAI